MASDFALGNIHAGDGKAGERVRASALPENHGALGAPRPNISLSRIDEGDMYRLGRQQELNVRRCFSVSNLDGPRLNGISATFDLFPSWASRSF